MIVFLQLSLLRFLLCWQLLSLASLPTARAESAEKLSNAQAAIRELDDTTLDRHVLDGNPWVVVLHSPKRVLRAMQLLDAQCIAQPQTACMSAQQSRPRDHLRPVPQLA